MRLEPGSEYQMIDRWCDHYEKTRDCFMGGNKIPIHGLIKEKIASGSLEVMMVKDNLTTIGFCAHYVNDGFLDGVALWLEPEHRNNGNMVTVFDLILDLASKRNLEGICFSSKLWGEAPLQMGFTVQKTVIDGEDTVTTWVKRTDKVH